MIARYCDRCGKLMSRQDTERLVVQEGDVQLEVMAARKGTWNQGDTCHDCIRAIIATSDHAPKNPQDPPSVVLRVVPVVAVEKAMKNAGLVPALCNRVMKRLLEKDDK